eukprot:532318_1
MGKCCSTVPEDIIYTPINPPNTEPPQKVLQQQDTSDSDDIIITDEKSISPSHTHSSHHSDAQKDTVTTEQIHPPIKQNDNFILIKDNINKQSVVENNNNINNTITTSPKDDHNYKNVTNININKQSSNTNEINSIVENNNSINNTINTLPKDDHKNVTNINIQKQNNHKKKNQKKEDNIKKTLLKLMEIDDKSIDKSPQIMDRKSETNSPIEMNGNHNEIKINYISELHPTHSVTESMDIIHTYEGNNDIHELRRKYIEQYVKTTPSKIVKLKSTHSVIKSKKIIAQYKNKKLQKLKKKYKTKDTKKSNDNNGKFILIDDHKIMDVKKVKKQFKKRRKSTHSVRRSSVIIKEYKGSSDIAILKKRYMRATRDSKTEQKILIPAKPENILNFMTENINILHSEMCEYITKHMHYIGMVEFRKGNEMCIDIEFISNNNGNIKGKRLLINDGKLANGNGKVYKDVLWNENIGKYEGCIKFEWIDKYNNIITKLMFNTNQFDYDIEHLYFEGKCYQYIMDMEMKDMDVDVDVSVDMEIDISNVKSINKGVFNMVCVSLRKRHVMKRNALLNYHETDIWDMEENELKMVPKYIKCMNITPVKMHQIFTRNDTL